MGRSFRKNRAFNLGIALTVAIVIGASTCLFVPLYVFLFRALPFPSADRLVMLWESNRETGEQHLKMMEGAYAACRRDLTRFDGLAAFVTHPPVLPPFKIFGTGERVSQVLATSDLFRVLDAAPLLGRTFLASEDRPRSPSAAVLSYRFWKIHFGGRSDVVGKPLVLDVFGERTDFTIVGVMPPEFQFPYPLLPDKPDLWLSLQYDEGLPAGNNFTVIGKLKPGVRIGQAQAEVDTIAKKLARQYPRFFGDESIQTISVQAESLRDAKAILVLLGVTLVFVMLIGCANILNLVMTRTVSRRREAAIRLAIGATRFDVARQVFLEIGLVVAIGGALGLLLGMWGVAALPALLPPSIYIPRADALAFDRSAVLFALAVCATGALISGIAAARRLTAAEPVNALRSSVSAAAPRSSVFCRPGSLLLVSEVALAVALVSGTFIVVQSLGRLIGENARFEPGRLTALEVFFSNGIRSDPERTLALYRQLLLNGKALPGIAEIALIDRFPISSYSQGFRASGAVGPISKRFHPAEFHVVSPSYGRIAGLSPMKGRWLNDSDRRGSTPTVVINEAMEQRYFPHQSPLGVRIRSDVIRFGINEFQIAGVVREPRRFGSGDDAPPAVYAPFAQTPLRNLTVVMKTTGDPRQSVAAVREEILRIAPGNIEVRTQTGEQIVAGHTARLRFVALDLAAFTALAVLLASLGIYSVISFYTSQRNHEIGVRMALGSTRTGVVRLVIRQGLALIAAGVMVGALLAYALARILASVRYDARPSDVVLYIAAAALFTVVGLAALWLPARRAASLDPLEVLRAE